MKLTLDVVGALIEDEGRYLVCKRLKEDLFGSLWEFPGGKVEKGEGKKEALKRELREELGLEIRVGELLKVLDDEVPEMKITVYLYKCSIISGDVRSIECQDFKWARLDEISKLDLAPADKKIVAFLEKERI